ncbi:MAG: hypothetical protein ABL895_17830 [Cyclobacteriaceae bacterium]
MKTLIVFSIAICLYILDQDNKIDLDSIFKVYESNIETEIKAILKQEYPDQSDKELIRARYNYLKSHTRTIAYDVKEVLKKQNIKNPDKAFLTHLIDSQYRNYYTGLPSSFFDKVHQEIERL